MPKQSKNVFARTFFYDVLFCIWCSVIVILLLWTQR